MSAAQMNNLDLMPPPVVQTIGRRSLIIGAIVGVVAIAGGVFQPTVFFRGYLLSFMAWLGIALGSMVILMLRHLTKGGWGMIIRRILGAAMRTLPLLALLFIPLLFALPRLYPWAKPLGAVPDKNLRQHSQNITHSSLNVQGSVMRALLSFAFWGTSFFLLPQWSKPK